jgi:thymidylate synthase
VKLGVFDYQYADAIGHIMDQRPETNARTGKRVKAAHGVTFHCAAQEVPLLALRNIKPLWTCAEVVWFMSGSDDARWMARQGFSVWDKFADEHGRVASATGYRWRQHFNVDQLRQLVSKLGEDPTSRQGVLLSWDPWDGVNPGPNVPCVMIWHFHSINGELHVSAMQRSADMYFGLPHDILGARLVQGLIAAKLGMRTGSISYLVSNAHLYEDQWEAAEEMMARADSLTEEQSKEMMERAPLEPRFSESHYRRACEGDEILPQELNNILIRGYEPGEPIKGPRLVL